MPISPRPPRGTKTSSLADAILFQPAAGPGGAPRREVARDSARERLEQGFGLQARTEGLQGCGRIGRFGRGRRDVDAEPDHDRERAADAVSFEQETGRLRAVDE